MIVDTRSILQVVVIIIISGLCWFANDKLNPVPYLKTVVQVLIVLASVLLSLHAFGLI